MSVLAAIAFAAFTFAGGQASPSPAPAASTAQAVAETAGSRAARSWVALLDAGRWPESWRSAGAAFRSRIGSEQWSSTILTVRAPLGQAASRRLMSVTATTTLPNEPAGQYEIVQFQTDFAGKPGSVETVVLTREGSTWKVNGYFIR